MVSAVDDAVGTVMGRIRREGLEQDTLVFFLSDNGGPTSNGSDNGPLRGHKATTWEGGIRVPFLVQWKGHLPAGKVYNRPVAQIDILPTALAAAGTSVDPGWKLDGMNLLPFLGGADKGDRTRRCSGDSEIRRPHGWGIGSWCGGASAPRAAAASR
jgi:arylsulfatase A-like enzyme